MNAIKRRRFSSKTTNANKKYVKWKFEDEMSFLLPYMLSGRAMSHEHSNEEEEEENEDGELAEAETAPTLKAEEPSPSPSQGHGLLHAPAYGSGPAAARRAEFTGAQEFVSVVMANGRAGSHSFDEDDEPERDEDDDESPRARRRPRKRPRPPSPGPCLGQGPEAMDDTDLFFLSMAKTVKKLPRVERVRIRMDLCRMVSEAELRNLTNGYRRK